MLAAERGGHRAAADNDRIDQALDEPGPRDQRQGSDSHADLKQAVHWTTYFSAPVSSTARNAFCGISTEPIDFIRFLPSFCLAHSLRLRVMSPP